MKWKIKDKVTPREFEKRTIRVFAWWPVKLSTGFYILFEWFLVDEMFIYNRPFDVQNIRYSMYGFVWETLKKYQ